MSQPAGVVVEAAVAVAWFVGATAFGRRVRHLAGVPAAGAAALAIDAVVGWWTIAGVALLLGLAGALGPWIGVLPVLALAAGRWRGLTASWRRLLPGGLAAVLLLPVAWARPFFYDALVYHLGLPWQALQEGRLAAHAENLFSTFPPLAQLLYLPALALGLERVPALLHLLAWVAASGVVAGLAARLGAGRWTAGLAGAATVLLPATALVPGFPAAEGWALLATVTAVAVATAPPRPGTALIAGFLSGAAVAARLQGLAWAVVVLVLVAWRSRARVASLVTATGACVATASLWWGKNLLLLGSPLAPVGWDREGVGILYRDGASTLHLADSLAAAGALIAGHLQGSWQYLVLLALAGVPVVVAERRARPLAAAAAAGLLAWAATGVLPRFLAPVGALLLALAAAGRRSRPARLAGAMAVLTVLIWGAGTTLDLLLRLGLTGPRPMASEPDPLTVNDPRPAFRSLSGLPRASRLLLVGEARPFGLPRRCVVTSQCDVSPLRPLLQRAGAGTVAHSLCDTGVTHLLVNWAELERLAPGYPVLPYSDREGAARFRSLLAMCGPPVAGSDGVEVFALPCASSP